MFTWSGSADGVYCEDDAGQQAVRLSFENKLRLFIKWVPTDEYDPNTDRRLALIGAIVVTKFSMKAPLTDFIAMSVAFKGSGPIMRRYEGPSYADSCGVCCVGLAESIYLTRGETFEAPPAPENSIGWIVEKNFYPREEGTGNIGTIEASLIDPSTGLPWPAGVIDCPVHIAFYYICQDTEYIPEPSTAFEEFEDIALHTSNDGQLMIIAIMEKEVGFTIGQNISGGGVVTALDIYFYFNFQFLVDNPDYILDVSFFGMTDMSIINTFTNLKKLKCDHNFLTTFDFTDLVRCELNWLNCDYNMLGNDNIEFGHLINNLDYLKMSHNYFNESYILSTISGAGSGTLDLFDISSNFLARMDGDAKRVKEFYCNNNLFPEGAYWTPSKLVATSVLRLTERNRSMVDFRDVEIMEFSNSELIDEDAQITQLELDIITDNPAVTTVAEAQQIIDYDPKYSEIQHDIYDPLNLPRHWSGA